DRLGLGLAPARLGDDVAQAAVDEQVAHPRPGELLGEHPRVGAGDEQVVRGLPAGKVLVELLLPREDLGAELLVALDQLLHVRTPAVGSGRGRAGDPARVVTARPSTLPRDDEPVEFLAVGRAGRSHPPAAFTCGHWARGGRAMAMPR